MNPKKTLFIQPAGPTRHLAGSLGLAAGLVIVSLLFLAALGAAESSADGPDQAQVVVVFPGEQGTVRSISFTTSISRVGALALAGWQVEASGDTVCSIEGVGCPASDCFCADNWWSSAGWDTGTETWDAAAWPPPDLTHGGIAGFRWSNPAWGPPLLPGPAYAAASKALDWLRPRQSETDGGYGNASSSSEMLLAIGANRHFATDWRRQPDSPSLLGYLLGKGAPYANSGAAEAGKIAVGLAAAGGCWPAGAKTPLDHYQPATGIFGSFYGSGAQAWAILGTRALSQAVPAPAVITLKDAQQANGGWEWAPTWGTDTNSTALALQALVAVGEPASSSVVVNGLNFLETSQNNDGGFPYDPASPFGTDSDANSTAYAIQALLATGQDPLTGTWVTGSSNPVSYLLSMQLPDGGFMWQAGRDADPLATRQVIPALLHQFLPLRVAAPEQCDTSFIPLILKES